MPERSAILELAILDVNSDALPEFERAFAEAQHIIATMPGYQHHELRRCAEQGGRYLLLVGWDSIESHTLGFRGSPQYEVWKQLLHHFYDPFPQVEHYVALPE